MNADTKQSLSPEAMVSGAIDDVLAAEREAARSLEAATAAATDRRRRANEDAHRILTRADRRIGAIHRRIAEEIRTQTSGLAQASDPEEETPHRGPDDSQLQTLADAVAEWLTTDADD